MSRSICTVDGCTNLVNAHGLCQKHECRLKKHGSVHGGLRNHASPQERLARQTLKDPETGCWLYTGYLRSNGYGSFQVGGKGSPGKLAHRCSYEFHKGPIPEGLQVMHSCDVRHCVNPEHLSLGTASDNMQDMHKKGRANRPKGETHWLARRRAEAAGAVK